MIDPHAMQMMAESARSRHATLYQTQDDKEFILGPFTDKYIFAKATGEEIGPDWRMYTFSSMPTQCEVWAVCVDIPEGWVSFDLPIFVVDEAQGWAPRQFGFSLHGKACNEENVKHVIYTILTTMKMDPEGVQ